MARIVGIFILASLVGSNLVACSSNSERPSRLGRPCSSNECGDGESCIELMDGTGIDLRAYPVCSKRCSSNADCGTEMACGKTRAGDMCLWACNTLVEDPELIPQNTACDGDVPVECAASDGSHCQVCGCPEMTTCIEGAGCVPKRQVGEPCQEHANCESGNCSEFFHICRVGLGERCTPDNCDLCHTGTNSYCSRTCHYERDCGGTVQCVRLFGDSEGQCYPPCSDSCPGTCGSLQGNSFCDLASLGLSVAPRPYGSACFGAAACQSGECWYYDAYNDLVHSGGAPRAGLCTTLCETSAECAAGSSCVDSPCAPDQTTQCGKRCLPHCETDFGCPGGYCYPRTSVEGTSLTVCDAKLRLDDPCGKNDQCESGNCCKYYCAEPDAACP